MKKEKDLEKDLEKVFLDRLRELANKVHCTVDELLSKLPPYLQNTGSLRRETLVGLYVVGQDAWPKCRLTPMKFIHHLAACLSCCREHDAIIDLAEMQVPDLFLLWAAVEGDEHAQLYIYNELLTIAVEKLPKRISEDIKNTIFAELFTNTTPLHSAYGGRSSLLRWLKTEARRRAYSEHRKAPRPLLHEQRPPSVTEALAVEDARARLLSRHQLKELVREVVKVEQLPLKERSILRLYYIDELPLTEIWRRVTENSQPQERLTYGQLRRWIYERDNQLRQISTEIARQQLNLGTQTLEDLVRTHLITSLVR